MREIILILCVLISIVAIVFSLLYNIHMFQLNGYKPHVHIKWIKANKMKHFNGIIVLFVSGFTYLLQNPLAYSIFAIVLFVNLLYCIKQRFFKAKIKLVLTSRVKRLIQAVLIIYVLLGVVEFLVRQSDVAFLLLGMCIFILPFTVLVANFLLKPVENQIKQYYINDAKKILKSSSGLTVIGITGSYGKTSVKFYLDTLLKSKFNVLTTPESYNTPMGIVKTIRGSLNPMHEIFLCEMGARNVYDIKEICDIVHPKHGLITSIGPQHLESFLSIENVINTKYELADSLPEDGMLFLNGDNEYIVNHKKYNNSIIYSTEKGGDYLASEINVSRTGTTFTVKTPNGEQKIFNTKIIGRHNVANILGAIAVSHKMGISLEDLIIPVRRLAQVPHRLQLIEKNNITVIDDAYNSNPIGSQAALETLAMFEEVKILVTPGMIELGDKQDKYNYDFGKSAAHICDYIALVGERQTQSIAKGILENGFDKNKLIISDSLGDAMKQVYSIQCTKRKIILLENDLPDNYN